MATEQGYVLVVEDIPDILKLLDATLQFKGFRVVTASNGKEALEVIQRELPALVIADILMPQMDGFSLLHRIRLNPETREIPVIFLSATYISNEDKEFARALGADRFIEKPVDWDKFLPIISDILARGAPTTPIALNELEFYENYRQRLESKLTQKITQIARDQHLLESLSIADKATIESSLRHAIKERDDIQLLLRNIREKLKIIKKN